MHNIIGIHTYVIINKYIIIVFHKFQYFQLFKQKLNLYNSKPAELPGVSRKKIVIVQLLLGVTLCESKVFLSENYIIF